MRPEARPTNQSESPIGNFSNRVAFRYFRNATSHVLVPLMLLGVVFFWGITDFGPGYDELIGDFQYGERTLYYLFSGEQAYLELLDPIPKKLIVSGHRDLATRELEAPFVHGHGAALGSAATCWLFFRTLGILSAVDAHHCINWIFASALISVLFIQIRNFFDTQRAWLTLFFLFGQPRLTAHFFFNIKDFPEACLFGLSLLFFIGAFNRHRGTTDDPYLHQQRDFSSSPPETVFFLNKHRSLITSMPSFFLSAFLFGFACSVKVNALFIPFILLSWCLLSLPSKGLFHSFSMKLIYTTGWGFPWLLTGWIGFIITWPYLWIAPEELFRYFTFILGRGHTGNWTFSFLPLLEWIQGTPEIVLIGTVFGIAVAVTKKEHAGRALLWMAVLWYLIPLVRANVPGMRHYDGIRHFIEITIPAAILAGCGWSSLFDWILTTRSIAPGKVPMVRYTLTGLLILTTIWTPLAWHPYPLAYFNRLSGGISEARKKGHPDAGDYWAASYRIGLRWINQNLPSHSVLAVPFAEHLVTLTRGSQWGLRADITLLHVTGPFTLEAGQAMTRGFESALRQGPVFVMFTPRKSWENEITQYAQRYGTPVFSEGSVSGEPLLSIYRTEQTPRIHETR